MAFGLKSLAFVDVIQGRRPKSKDQDPDAKAQLLIGNKCLVK